MVCASRTEKQKTKRHVFSCNASESRVSWTTDEDACFIAGTCLVIGEQLQCVFARKGKRGRLPSRSFRVVLNGNFSGLCRQGVCRTELVRGNTGRRGSLRDDLFCSSISECLSGECIVVESDTCNDGSPCTADSCDEDADTCNLESVANGTPCEDNDACTWVGPVRVTPA